MTATTIPAARDTRVFRPLTMLLLLLAGVFSFSAYLVLSAYAPDLQSGDDGGAQALSRSAVGFAGMVRLLQAEGVAVQINRDDASKRDPAWSLLVLTPDPSTKPADLASFAAAGPTLVVLPKWQTEPDGNNSSWVQSAGFVDPDDVKTLLGALSGTVARNDSNAPAQLSAAAPLSGGFQTGAIDHLQGLVAQNMIPVLTDQSGAVVLARTPDSHLYILSDPDLLNTHGIKDLGTARAGETLIEGLRNGDGPVAFDVSLNGIKHSPSLLKLAFEPPFLGATLCLVGAAFLMALHALSRFGAPARTGRALALGKRALAENSAGLIRMARREPHMAGGYLDLNRNAVAKALGAVRLSGAELDAYIDRLGERTGAGRLSGLAAESATIKDRAGLVGWAKRLYQWRLEMTRERR